MTTFNEKIKSLPEKNGNYERLTALGALAREVEPYDEGQLYQVGLVSLRDYVIQGLADEVTYTDLTLPMDSSFNDPASTHYRTLRDLWLIGFELVSNGRLPDPITLRSRHRDLIARVQRDIYDSVLDGFPGHLLGQLGDVVTILNSNLQQNRVLTLGNMLMLDAAIPEELLREIPHYDSLYFLCWMASYHLSTR